MGKEVASKERKILKSIKTPRSDSMANPVSGLLWSAYFVDFIEDSGPVKLDVFLDLYSYMLECYKEYYTLDPSCFNSLKKIVVKTSAEPLL